VRVEVTVLDPAQLREAARVLRAFSTSGTEHVDEAEHKVTVPVREEHAIVPAVVRALDEAGVSADDVVVHRPTLDDVFLELTGHALADDDAPVNAFSGGQ